jgi:CheY-like chemotaxis protein
MTASGMTRDPVKLLPPRILVVDDERQIHASIRLRLGGTYELAFSFEASDALEKIRQTRFDLCLADIHMPKMDGLAFIDAAQAIDPCLGFVVISAFDSRENLRRAIPLQVFEFVSKPLPERAEFEGRLPAWIERTRQRRRDHDLAVKAEAIAADRDIARLEREVELVASETAREALLQAAGLLTTIHAHLQSATTVLASRVRTDPSASHLLRGLEEARKTADAAMTVTGGFFDSSYGSRDQSPALPNEGIFHAINIAQRMVRAAETGKAVEFQPLAANLPIKGLSGIDFLLLLAPALGAALACAAPNTTVGVRSDFASRIDTVPKDPLRHGFLWLNRKHALGSHPAMIITISASAAPLTVPGVEAWLGGDYAPLTMVSSRGLLRGIEKCHGLFGVALAPHADRFGLALVLPN